MLNHFSPFVQRYFSPLLGVIAALLLVLLFILPTSQKIDNLNKKKIEIEKEIDNTKRLIEAKQAQINRKLGLKKKKKSRLKGLKNNLKDIQSFISKVEPGEIPKFRPYSQSLTALPKELKTMAQEQGLEKISLKLDNKPINRSNELLLAHVSGAARIETLRKYIISLLEKEFVKDIKQIHIQRYLDKSFLQVSFSIGIS